MSHYFTRYLFRRAVYRVLTPRQRRTYGIIYHLKRLIQLLSRF